MQIVEAALDLFVAKGFDETTMEEIAERAEIGSSTLYRYFPSKDLVILDPLLSFAKMGDFLRERPTDEPFAASLAAVIATALAEFSNDGRLAEVRRIVDATPGPRARLWDVMATFRDDLEHAIADRLGLPSTDLSVVLTARNAMIVYELAAEAWWAGDHSRDVADVVAEVLAGVRKATISLPG
jgi:AcrR family transcriptional regulator